MLLASFVRLLVPSLALVLWGAPVAWAEVGGLPPLVKERLKDLQIPQGGFHGEHDSVERGIHDRMHLYDRVSGQSKDPLFRRMMHFSKGRSTKGQNTLQERLPRAQALDSPEEAFATASELFLLDREYRCRHPARYAYLESVLRFQPFPDGKCKTQPIIYLDPEEDPVWLDPSRVSEVHLLSAAPGGGIESQFGHLMLRLIVCGEGTEKGPSCREDLQDHVILSFSADLSKERGLNPILGLLGGYKTRLFARSLPEVLIEYTETDLRDLASVPLRLSEAEKRQLVYHALEVFWTYQSRYYFVTNNCATELLQLLQGAILRPELQALSASTPKGVLDGLHRIGMLEVSHLAAPRLSQKEGLYFESLKKRYEGEYLLLRPHLPNHAPGTLGGYLEKTHAGQRRAWLSGLSTPELVSAALSLEGLLLRKQEQVAKKVLLQGVYRLLDSASMADPRRKEVASLLYGQVVSPPWAWVQRGYGLPLADDGLVPPRRPGLLKGQRLYQKLVELSFATQPKDAAEVRQIEENRHLLRQRILNLAEAQGELSHL